MWPRTIEVMLAVWLAISPFVFRHPAGEPDLWWNDWVCAALIALFACLSYVRQTRRAHLLTLLVAFWLIGYGWATAEGIHDGPRQNWIVLGLLLLMTAIIPSGCLRPPLRWQEWNDRHGIGRSSIDPYGARPVR